MRFGKAAIVALCLATVGAAGHPSTAAASDASIKRAINRYDHKILVAEGHLLSAIGQYKKTGQPAGVEAALSKSIAVFRSLKAKIAAQSAVAPKVKQGKLKLIKGLQAVISAYQHLKTAFAIKATNAAAAKEQAEKAEAAVRKGQEELREGLQLLK
jgi:multidrug resistance efflux pump